MRKSSVSPSPRASFWLILAMLAMVAVPAAITLHTVRVSVLMAAPADSSPCGYTVSLLLFIVPIIVIAFWLIPHEEIKVSKKAFWWTIALLFPVGALLDFFFARYFFYFPNMQATLGIKAPALGAGVPIEEYVFYLTAFLRCYYFISGWTNTGFLLTPFLLTHLSGSALPVCCNYTRSRLCSLFL